MDEDRCEKTDLIKSQCSHCRGLDRVEVKPDRLTGFHAQYEGWCEFGDHPIDIEDVICFHPESFSYVHLSCAQRRGR